MAQVRCPTRTWLPMLEVDGVPIAYDATLKHYRGGHASLVAGACWSGSRGFEAASPSPKGHGGL